MNDSTRSTGGSPLVVEVLVTHRAAPPTEAEIEARAAGADLSVLSSSDARLHLVHRSSDRGVAVVTSTPDPQQAPLDLSQTWGFDDAASIARSVQRRIVVAESSSSEGTASERVTAFHAALCLVSELFDAAAVWNAHTTHLAAIERVVKDPLAALANVRLFRVADMADGTVLMDTVGLAPLGLLDLQCVTARVEPAVLANVLWDATAFLVREGDVIADGDTISGPHPEHRWTCRVATAEVAPARPVLDVFV